MLNTTVEEVENEEQLLQNAKSLFPSNVVMGNAAFSPQLVDKQSKTESQMDVPLTTNGHCEEASKEDNAKVTEQKLEEKQEKEQEKPVTQVMSPTEGNKDTEVDVEDMSVDVNKECEKEGQQEKEGDTKMEEQVSSIKEEKAIPTPDKTQVHVLMCGWSSILRPLPLITVRS